MPGIVGYVGRQDAGPLVVAGLQRLEYRGYDAAGIAVQDAAGRLVIRRGAGPGFALADLLADPAPQGHAAMRHMRWATHGRPSEANAHAHSDCSATIAVLHGGIIPNFLSLQAGLRAQGHVFLSETDTEVLPHLIEQQLRDGA